MIYRDPQVLPLLKFCQLLLLRYFSYLFGLPYLRSRTKTMIPLHQDDTQVLPNWDTPAVV